MTVREAGARDPEGATAAGWAFGSSEQGSSHRCIGAEREGAERPPARTVRWRVSGQVPTAQGLEQGGPQGFSRGPEGSHKQPGPQVGPPSQPLGGCGVPSGPTGSLGLGAQPGV